MLANTPNYREDRLAYLGKGLSFPMGINIQGNLQTSSDISNIEESIRIILDTKLGERVYRPNFGCRLSELTFAPMNTKTLMLIRLYVETALTTWEPRIIIEGIYTEADPLHGKINITIAYQVKKTYDSRSLVYPFYLNPNG
jgi:phage baseplate assembly protein W